MMNYARTLAPLVKAGFPAVVPGQPFGVRGDEALHRLHGAATELPVPWGVFSWHAENLDEPAPDEPRTWRCQVIDTAVAVRSMA